MTTSTAPTTVMSLNSVSRDYRQGDETVHALRSTNLQLRAGELVGILGPSGSGKSTLLTVMGGLRTPSSGTVTISGEPFSALPEKRRARLRFRRIGFVLQASGLVPFLRLNDQFGLHNRVGRTKDNTDRRDHLLDSLGISKRAHAYPSELSGGERQRAAIAVALYHEPDIILADEPTASLDTRHAQDVAHLLADQTHELGKATVMVTHDERLLPMCDRVLVMHDGVLTEKSGRADSH
ncbi:ABC transporter ATP-binding protein [Actinomyces johnsonii]|uniref:Putative hemin import ATP-binding protein HrtA n=2 Tax=Actinomyces johnsonii TaxID=544581 RepID=U1Q1R6_9ACTO|nr:ABC transporter ATP-binding protein [Actinomyces johnsonii]ERH21915.1 ABC transporter, ATP-binding protein [Actinomyces johnsonii F0510]KAA8744018.1 ABC transporter ATP-binding protein [Actinomyces johnsonii]TQD42864.1 ABC transporter ATP-binding protein [Actinomyces johnsonii]